MHNPHALQGYSTSNITYPMCAVDEDVLQTKFPEGFNSSNENYYFSSN
jgi:hypothetical protein